MNVRCEDWKLVPIKEALEKQDEYWKRRVRNEIPDTVIFAEHEPIYTVGAMAKTKPSCQARCFKINKSELPCPVLITGRGGLVTYQGPGILSVYCALGLKNLTIREFENILLASSKKTFERFGIKTEKRFDNPGLYIGENKKIVSVGLQISRGVSRYGLSMSLDPDKKYLEPLIPCGLEGVKLTSLVQELGIEKFSREEKNIIKTALAIKLISCLDRFRKETN